MFANTRAKSSLSPMARPDEEDAVLQNLRKLLE